MDFDILNQKIIDSKKNITNFIFDTKLKKSEELSSKFNKTVLFKHEYMQLTGSFKIRGALNALINLRQKKNIFGILGLSSGNHGLGLAKACNLNRLPCVICMSSNVPNNKIELIKSENAEVRILGRSQDEVELKLKNILEKEKLYYLPPFDHIDIICGQGTLGLEISQNLTEIDKIIIPISGGGLISGISIIIKQRFPKCKIIGVSMEKGAAMFESQKFGFPKKVKEEKTIADALSGGIGINNQYTFNIVKRNVDEIITVTENEIIEAIKFMFFSEKKVIEGAGAVGIASVLSKKVQINGTTVILLSGGNINQDTHNQIIKGNYTHPPSATKF
tara:strand:+ start:924 stop:1922 length:999 start_codon:yes stop_codon:yes gene_type:complete